MSAAHRTFVVGLLGVLLASGLIALPPDPAGAAPPAPGTTRVSVSTAGNQADSASSQPSISADGQRVAFSSTAANLIDGDTNAVEDVFVRFPSTGITHRVSVGGGGEQATGSSSFPTVSADARFVSFTSEAANLVPGDTNEGPDIFVANLEDGAVERVSLTSAGVQIEGGALWSSISADGRFVVFVAVATNLPDSGAAPFSLYLRDRVAGTTSWLQTEPVPLPGESPKRLPFSPRVSVDGSVVTFWSVALDPNPTSADDLSGAFVHQVATGQTTRLAPAVGPGEAVSSVQPGELPGDTGLSFNFRNACRVHDYGYDILRFCGWSKDQHVVPITFGSCSWEWGKPLAWTRDQVIDGRHRADYLFLWDMSAHCDTRVLEEQCKDWAARYSAGVVANTALQILTGHEVP